MAITIREYLGDEKIAQLEKMGFLPSLITDMAKRQYAADKQAKRKELSDVGLDGKLVQSVMRGDINEEEARNAQKFEDFGSKRHGWGLGAAKTLTGIANTVERVGDFVNPFYEGKHDENGNYTYQNSIEQALRPKIQNAQKLRDDYEKATGETSWGSRLAEIGTEMVGDPINFIGGAGLLSKGSKLAQFGKKTLFFAGTGAASGGVMALGEGKNDEETLKNIGYGAAGGFVLGHAIDQGIQGISKLIAKRQTNKVANEADAIESAKNSEFLDGSNNVGGDGVGTELKEAQTMTAREFATKEVGLDEDTATNVLKEAMQGKEKSDWTDADTYADIVKFKNFEIQREYAKAYGEKIQAAQVSINNAREQSAIRYADTQKAINEYQKQGMSPSAARELINAKFKPSVDEINYTRAYNDGVDVDARLAGQGIFYALEKDIAAQAYTPEIYATRLKQRGFSDESVQAFTQAYVSKDINIAKDYANSKVADAYENKIQREVANEIRDRDEVGGGFVNEEAKNSGLSDSVSDIGDNASRTRGRQASDEQILRQGGRNTSSASQTKRTAQSDEQMEQRPAFKTDGDTDATAASKQMVEEQGNGDNEISGHVGQTQEEYKKLANEYDVDKFLSDRENVLSKDVRHGKNRITDRTIESNDGVGGWEYKLTPAGYEKNYKADFLTTKADVAKIRAGKMDEATFNKLKSDLESSDALGYEYKKGSEYADMEDFEREFGSLYNPKGGRNINANSHIASGLVGGTLNSIDEDGNFNPDRFAAGFLAGLAGSKAVAITTRKMTPKLYNEILGVANKMPQMAKGNPKLLGKLYSNGKDISINSFAGEKAITANVGKLDQAKAMLKKGADEVEIWQKTGWFKDKDGAWKFEIGDSKARLNPNFKSGGRLGELLEHEELFKAYPELEDISIKKISNNIPKEASLSTKDVAQREKRGIYNVTYNDKSATLVRRDLEKIDDALMFEKGSNKKGGAIHIKKHLEPEAQGAITQSELLNIGKNIREYLQKFKEPFIDEHGGRIYEWGNKEGVKFRVVVYEKTDGISASHPETIISFYSNRNLKKPMEFRNPEVKYDVNLRQWHKDSAPITKNADGSPKTFYHGSKAKDITEFKDEFDKSGYGFWFNQSKSAAVEFKQDGKIYQVYLNVKNPIDLSFPYSRKAKNLLDEAEKLGIDTELYPESQSGAFKKFLEQKGYDGIVMDDLDGAAKYPHVIVFHSNQIKHVKNDGNFSDSPNIYKSGAEGYYDPARNEIGLSDLGDKSTLMHEVQHAIQEIEDFSRGSGVKGEGYRLSHGEAEARNVQNRLNLDDTVGTHPHETFDVNPNETIVSKEGIVNLSKELEKKYILKDGSINEAAVRKEAEPFIEKEYSLKNFKAEFPNGKVDTPIGEVDISVSQFYKLGHKGRDEYFGLIKPTLERPAFVVDFEDTTFFFKPFRDKDGVVKFASVIKERDGGLDVISNYPMKNRKFELITREGKVRYVQGSVVVRPLEHSLDDTVRSSSGLKPIEHSSDGKDIIQQNEEKVYHSRNIEEIRREHPNVEKELDESIVAMRKESFNDSNFKDNLISKFDKKEIATQQLGKSVKLSNKQLAVLKNDIKNADFKAISDSKIYFDKIGKDGDKKRFFIDIAEDGNIRVDAYAKSQIDNMHIKENALQELAGVGDRARLKNMSFEAKAAYFNELDPIKKEAILKTAELNKLKKAAQSGDKVAVAKFEEFKAKNLDKDGNIKDGLRLC
nr:MAG TPA: PolyVal ADP-Ribosyltransferase [Caudoviricetes sp.]